MIFRGSNAIALHNQCYIMMPTYASCLISLILRSNNDFDIIIFNGTDEKFNLNPLGLVM